MINQTEVSKKYKPEQCEYIYIILYSYYTDIDLDNLGACVLNFCLNEWFFMKFKPLSIEVILELIYITLLFTIFVICNL